MLPEIIGILPTIDNGTASATLVKIGNFVILTNLKSNLILIPGPKNPT